MCDLAEETTRLEAKLSDLRSQIKNRENTLRQVTDAVSAMSVRLKKLEDGSLKLRGL